MHGWKAFASLALGAAAALSNAGCQSARRGDQATVGAMQRVDAKLGAERNEAPRTSSLAEATSAHAAALRALDVLHE